MSERAEQMKKLRLQGMSYEEIGKAFDISRQRVYQIIGGTEMNYFKEIKPDECVYPNLRKWLNENRINRPKLTRLMYSEEKYAPTRWEIVCRALEGANCRKTTIDRILKATGLTYEEAFGRNDAE